MGILRGVAGAKADAEAARVLKIRADENFMVDVIECLPKK